MIAIVFRAHLGLCLDVFLLLGSAWKDKLQWRNTQFNSNEMLPPTEHGKNVTET